MQIRNTVTAAALALFGLGVTAAPALATALNALPESSGINATDTFPVCQTAAGCGPANALAQMPMASVFGTVGASITGTTTLGNSYNNILTPVSGTGYTITLPQSTASMLPPGSKIYLAGAPGASVSVCISSGSAFDTNSPAPIGAVCSGGASGVALAGGQMLAVTAETGSKYFAALASAGAGAVEAVKTGNYAIAPSDAFALIPWNCSSPCAVTLPAVFPKGGWVEIHDEIGATASVLVAATSPSIIYGDFPLSVTSGQIPIDHSMGARFTFDGTNWYVSEWGTVPNAYSVPTTGYEADVWNCVQTIHFTAATAVTLTIPAGLPAGCNLNYVQDGAGAVNIVGGSGFTLHAPNGDAHSGGQYATFFVAIEPGGTAGVLGGNIAP